jgi:hypothetical protein
MGTAAFSSDTHVTTQQPNGLGLTKAILFASTGGSQQPAQSAQTPVMPIQAQALYYLSSDYYVLAGFNGQTSISVVWLAQDRTTVVAVNNVFGKDYRGAPAPAAALLGLQQILAAPVNAVYAVTSYNCTWPSGASAGSAYAGSGTAPNAATGSGAGMQFNQTQDPTTYQNGVAGSYVVPNGAVWTIPGGASYVRINSTWVVTSNAITISPGTILLSTHNIGALSFAFPPGTGYSHADVYLCGCGGNGSGVNTGSGKSYSVADVGGSGASSCIATGVAVSPGSSTVNYNLSGIPGSPSTLTGAGLNLICPSGNSATSSAEGAAPAPATGGTTNWTGRAGGLTNSWDGGGCYDPSGAVADNVTDGSVGSGNGVGGAGTYYSPSAGGPAFLQIIARA